MPADDHDEPCSGPLDLEQTIRTVICTSDTTGDLATRVQCAIGEYAHASDELHVSHAIAPDARAGLMLYSASSSDHGEARTETGPGGDGTMPSGSGFQSEVQPAR
jgi:hypothetical protein